MSSPDTAAVVRSTAFALALFVAPGLLAAQQPRDPRTEVARPETQREVELKAATVSDPANVANWLELATLQEARGAVDEVERTFKAAQAAAVGPDRRVLTAAASFYTRQAQFDKSIEALQAAADLNPIDPLGHHLVATYYWEKAFKDHSLTPAEKLTYIDGGLAATDRALAQKADFADAMTYKNILLRMKAQHEPDPARRDALIADADAWRTQAMQLRPSQGTPMQTGAPVPPPPPAPGAPVRVGGNIKTPTKIQHVSPVYPQEAQDARVSGMVIIEVMIDAEGNVSDARVLRSIPMLDQAALDAVKQWRFTPTLLNGAPVTVLMTVTVNFTLQ